MILVPEVLGDSPSLQEILWNFCRSEDKKNRLTLKDNPHFYAELPTLLKAHGDSVKIDSTEDFRHANKFYVLTDKQELVHIMTDNKILHSFGNLWRSENGIILKGSDLFFVFPHVSDLLTDICGRLRGEGIVNTSLRGTYSEFYKRLPVSTGTGIPLTFRTRNDRGLQPVVTELYPWTGWEPFISTPMESSVDLCLHFFTKQAAPNSPVRSKVIKNLTMSANFNVAPGSLATNI
jgi:hypothetical protein